MIVDLPSALLYARERTRVWLFMQGLGFVVLYASALASMVLAHVCYLLAWRTLRRIPGWLACRVGSHDWVPGRSIEVETEPNVVRDALQCRRPGCCHVLLFGDPRCGLTPGCLLSPGHLTSCITLGTLRVGGTGSSPSEGKRRESAPCLRVVKE